MDKGVGVWGWGLEKKCDSPRTIQKCLGQMSTHMPSEFLFLSILTLQGITPRLGRVRWLLQGCTAKNTARILTQQGSLWFRQASLLEAVGWTSDFLEQACLMDSLQVSVWTSSWLKSLPRVFPESPLAHTPDTDMELGRRRGMSKDMLTLAQLWGELQQPKLGLLDKPDTC